MNSSAMDIVKPSDKLGIKAEAVPQPLTQRNMNIRVNQINDKIADTNNYFTKQKLVKQRDQIKSDYTDLMKAHSSLEKQAKNNKVEAEDVLGQADTIYRQTKETPEETNARQLDQIYNYITNNEKISYINWLDCILKV